MSLILCPDCGHEVSTAATACLNCGRPISDPTLERNVVVAQTPLTERDEFPKWVFIPIGLITLILLFTLFVWMREKDETANVNLNVDTTTTRK